MAKGNSFQPVIIDCTKVDPNALPCHCAAELKTRKKGVIEVNTMVNLPKKGSSFIVDPTNFRIEGDKIIISNGAGLEVSETVITFPDNIII